MLAPRRPQPAPPVTPPAKPADWIDTENTPERRILDLRQAGMRHALTLGHLRYHQASRPLEPQCHDHWLVLVFLLSGTQRYQIDGREVPLRGGEALRILPGQTYSTGTWPEQRGELAWLILDPPRKPGTSALGMSAEGTTAVFSLLADPGAPQVRPMPAEIPALVADLFACWRHRAEVPVRERIRNRVAAIVLAMTATPADGQAGENPNFQRIRRVLDWLDKNEGDIPDVEAMARHAGLSQALFHRHFKQITGCTPHDYELRLKINRAATVLAARPDTSITRLAHDLGFASSQYFATVFKRYLGTPPGGFRDLNRPK